MDVLADDVHLEVDAVARSPQGEGGHLQSVRNQGHLKAVGKQSGDGQADAVDGHRPLLHQEAARARKEWKTRAPGAP